MNKKEAQTSVPIQNNLALRWSPRAFSDRPVEPKKLTALFEAARWAASSSNEQPWRFIVAQQGDPHYDKLLEGLVDGNRKWAHKAPVLCATLALKNLQQREGKNKHAWHDLGLAMGNLSTQATEMGLHVHQMAGIKPDTVAENFGVDTEQMDVVTMFVVGYHDPEAIDDLPEGQAKGERSARQRKPLEELLFTSDLDSHPDWLQ